MSDVIPIPPQPPVATICLTLQGSVMTSNMITPTVLLNGHRVQSSYGVNRYPVPPGHWKVELYAQWLRRYGQATIDVEVAQNQQVDLFYAAPFHQFASGNIGFEKQKRKGLAALMAILLLVVLSAIGLIALGAL